MLKTIVLKRVLVAILNWGLGHASRCVPLIKRLRARAISVELASDGRAAAFLRQSFPQLPLHPLPSYNIRYPYQAIK